MQSTKPCATEWAYAERRVRELLAKGWQRRNIVVRVANEIRRQRTQHPAPGAEETR